MIQRSRNNPRNGDTAVPRVQNISRYRSHLASVFWDEDGILLVNYLKLRQSTVFLEKLKQLMVSKLGSELSKGILFLQDNAQGGNKQIKIGRTSRGSSETP
jgi:hypothetical protein